MNGRLELEERGISFKSFLETLPLKVAIDRLANWRE
jgi:hypothetical protein